MNPGRGDRADDGAVPHIHHAGLPLVLQSLKAAKIIEVGPDAAIASVTTPANITSWLSPRKEGNAWKIVGRAPLENLARRYASPREQPADQPGQKEPDRKRDENMKDKYMIRPG